MLPRRDPAYLALHASGELAARARTALDRLRSCDLCPHCCRVDRTAGGRGRCRVGRYALLASAGAHFGEETPLVGDGGSGTMFFSGCNLFCRFCQNAEISQGLAGHTLRPDEMAASMLRLQDAGCVNLNLVSPSHVVAQVLEALVLAADGGFHLPLVYNTGGYDSLETLRLLDGVVDIYLPDMKYGDSSTALRLSGIPDYLGHNRAAVREMHRQVGNLVTDKRGVAWKGLLVRHLVLPEELAGTAAVAGFLGEEVSSDTYLNLMKQYRPCHEAWTEPALSRRVTASEYDLAARQARAAGLWRLDR
jgi:putative pyruvate formate lyase activating enzyme